MTGIVVYIEGGSNRTADVEFRQAFRSFFNDLIELAKLRNVPFKLMLVGSREDTFRKFRHEAERDRQTFHVLLVDSETEVNEFGKCWKHLKESDGWDCPAGVHDTQCHLMVVAMEAWFFADVEALAAHYGQGFKKNALPKTQNVEQIPKQKHLESLKAAVKETTKGRYDKFADAPKILARLKTNIVRSRAPHCERLFTTLTNKINGV